MFPAVCPDTRADLDTRTSKSRRALYQIETCLGVVSRQKPNPRSAANLFNSRTCLKMIHNVTIVQTVWIIPVRRQRDAPPLNPPCQCRHSASGPEKRWVSSKPVLTYRKQTTDSRRGDGSVNRAWTGWPPALPWPCCLWKVKKTCCNHSLFRQRLPNYLHRSHLPHNCVRLRH